MARIKKRARAILATIFRNHAHHAGMGAWRALRELSVTFAGADVRVLCYHSVRSRARFAAHMDTVAEQGYTVISLPELTGWLSGAVPCPASAVLLTFDGGYGDQLENAAPVLDGLKFPATFFPTSGDLDDPGNPISRRDLTALVAAGHTIGCHTHTHPDLTTLSPEALESEVIGSKAALEDALGRAIDAFSYPYGVRNPAVVSAVRRAGFSVAFTIDLGGVDRRDDPYQLNRIAVLGEPSAAEFASYLAGTRLVSGALLGWWKIRERRIG